MEIISQILCGGERHAGRVLELIYNVLNANSISTEAEIGRNTVFFHHGLGCVVHRDCIIGDNCKIFGNVTIGCKWSNGVNDGKPTRIGDNVLVGAGAVILGDIYIGDNSIIGANTTVITDVPEKCIAVGNPARIQSKRSK